MHFLTVSLFLSLFLVTQATDLSSNLNMPPLSEPVYIFKVTSDAPIDQLKGCFNLTGGPRHSFRVIGEKTFYFVLASNNITALRQLTFPAGSTVIQYPVEHIADYTKMFGVDTGFEENDTAEALPDKVLTFAEWEFRIREGTPVELFNLMMRTAGNNIMAVHNNLTRVVYVPIAYYPTKVIIFSDYDDNAHQHIAKDFQDVFGGIGYLTSKTKHVVKI